jgi:hypothetical protein
VGGLPVAALLTCTLQYWGQAGTKYAVVLEFLRPEEGTYMWLQWSLIGGTQVGQMLAVKAAAAADIIIAVVGEDTRTCGEVHT